MRRQTQGQQELLQALPEFLLTDFNNVFKMCLCYCSPKKGTPIGGGSFCPPTDQMSVSRANDGYQPPGAQSIIPPTEFAERDYSVDNGFRESSSPSAIMLDYCMSEDLFGKLVPIVGICISLFNH